jgi:hypothetical protein
MNDIADFGVKIQTVLLERQIHIRDFLKELKVKYPDERGLTENGFRYSLKNGTMKVSMLAKVSNQLGLTIDHWFGDNKPLEVTEYLETIEKLQARVVELEKDKENLQDLITILKEQDKVRKG